MTDHQGAAQDFELRAETHLMLMQVGFWQVDKQQQRFGKRDDGENAEGAAPAERIGNQRADGNAKHGGANDAETDLGNGAPGVIGADDIHCRFTGQRPEHRQPQRWNQASEGHHPDVRRKRGKRVGQTEHDQHRDEQLAAFESGEIGRQERPERGDGESKQGHQQSRLGDAHREVAGDGRQQADNDELCGQHGKTGGGQQKNGQQHAELQKTTTPAIARRPTGGT